MIQQQMPRRMNCKCVLIKLGALFVTISWCAVIYYGVFHGLSFLNDTHWKMDPPVGSPSQLAVDAAYNLMPHKLFENQFYAAVVVSSETENVIKADIVKNFTFQLQEAAVDCGPRQKDRKISKCFIRSSESYFNLRNDLERMLMKRKFVSRDEKATIIFFHTNNHNLGNTYQYSHFDNLQKNHIDKFVASNPQYNVEQTYEQLILRDGQTQVIGDFEHADIITLPIACLVLFAVVGAPCVLVTFTLSASALTGFLIMIPMATAPKDKRVNFPSFSPSIFVCMLLAMALDYALFLFVRYREALKEVQNDGTVHYEKKNNAAYDSNMVAVYKVLKTSGKVVFLSATILAASFFGLSFVDVPMVSSIGIGGAVVVLSTMVVNLTLVPSLLILIGPYLYSCHGCSSSGSSDNYIKNADSLLPNDHNNDPLGAKQDIEAKEAKRCYCCPYICTNHTELLQGFYYRIGKFVEKRKFAVSFIIFAITAAFVPILLDIHISINQLLVTPRNAPSLRAFLTMKEFEIPRGLTSPINIMVKAPLPQIDTNFRSMPCSDDDIDFKIEADNHYIGEYLQSCSDALQAIPEFCTTKKKVQDVDIHKIAANLCQKTCPEYCPKDRNRIFDDAVFDTISLFKEELKKMDNREHKTSIFMFEDIVTLPNGTSISPTIAYSLLQNYAPSDQPTVESLYVDKFTELTSYDRNTVYLRVIPNGYVFNEDAIQLLLKIRTLSNHTEFKDYKFYVASQSAQLYDLTSQVYQQCPPLVVGIVVVVVFVLSGVAFRSLLLSFRLLITISVTIIWVGTFTSVIFDLMGFGVYWLVPVCCVPIITGLTLDYDTFLIARIYELRGQGYSSRFSILKGLKVSGSSITYAGLIMAVTFSALLFTPEFVLNQFGAVLVLSSLLDTLLVRGFLVPSLLFIGGDKLLWWPNRMPPVLKNDAEAELEEDGYAILST